jgi:hypothetical protein
MAVNPNTDFTAGAILTADQQNRFPRGVMGYATGATARTLTTSPSDITGMSVTFTAVANRLYKISWNCFVSQTDAFSRVIFDIVQGASTVINGIQNTIPNNGGFATISFSSVNTFSAGSITIKMAGQTTAGTASIQGSATAVHSLIIEDVGPV